MFQGPFRIARGYAHAGRHHICQSAEGIASNVRAQHEWTFHEIEALIHIASCHSDMNAC